MQQAVIYAFCSPGSGGVYIGKHAVTRDALEKWPRRGTGCLPDGYRGSGVVVGHFHRKHGAAVQWRILARVTGTRDRMNAAERRAIRLARHILGRLCVNQRDGGDGITSERARELWSDPERMAGVARKHLDPDFAARRDAQFAEFQARPRTPEHKAKLAACLNKWNGTPEAKAHLAVLLARNHTPEVIAKTHTTRRRRAHNRRVVAKWMASLPPEERARWIDDNTAVQMTMRDASRVH